MAALLYVSLWGAAIVVTVPARNTLPVPDEMADLLFWSSFLIGMAAFVWALAYLRGEFLGLVEP